MDGRSLGSRIGLALLVLLAVVAGCSAMGDWDIWWHLKTGELAWARCSTLPVDVFSLTHPGESWVYKDLGAEVLLFWVYDSLGETGLALLQLCCSVTLLVLMLLLLRRQSRDMALVILVAGAAFLIARFRIIVRPELFSIIFFPAFLLLIDTHRHPGKGGHRPRWLLWLLVLGQWIWANLHRGALLGLVLVWGYVLAEGIARLVAHLGHGKTSRSAAIFHGDRGPGDQVMTIALFALLATAVTALNPSGFVLFTQSIEVTTSETLARVISEWHRLDLVEWLEAFPVAAVWAGLIPVMVVLLLALGRAKALSLWNLGLAAVFLAWGFKAARMLPYLAMGTAPLMANALDTLVWGKTKSGSSRIPGLPVLAGVSILALAVLTRTVDLPDPGWAAAHYPERATRLILSRPVRGEGLTTYTFAGYLLFHAWPDKHVLCDGRFDTVYPEQTILTCLSAEENPEVLEQLRRRYHLQWVLAHNRPGPSRSPDHPRAFDFLDVHPDWALVHWDESALLYVWRHGGNAAMARENGYRYLRPHDPDVSLFEILPGAHRHPQVMRDLDLEVWRLYRDAPDDYRAAIVLALFLHQTGRRESEEFRMVFQQIESARDRDPEAIDQVLEFISR